MSESNLSIETYDAWLEDHGPAAIVIRQPLRPVTGGERPVLFPPTYAGGTYNIDYIGDDPDGADRKPVPTPNVCLVDSVGSQANRIEPAFKEDELATLVPQVVIEVMSPVKDENGKVVKGTDGKPEEWSDPINLLDAGHRVADALVRFSSLARMVEDALNAYRDGDAEQLAKLAPTTLVFGAWDSRATQVKLPRIVAATIRAYDVRELRRSAQYQPPKDYVLDDAIADHGGDKAKKDRYSEEGLLDNPGGTFAHGGVIADRVLREATLNLATIRDLRASDGSDDVENRKLQRYVLGLALVAVTHLDGKQLSLCQGCQLVGDGDPVREVIGADGKAVEDPPVPAQTEALGFAGTAAEAFVVGDDQSGTFNRKEAEEFLKKSSDVAKKERTAKAARRVKKQTEKKASS